MKKATLKNFAKSTGKTTVPEPVFNKAANLSLQLYEKKALAQVFFCEFCESFQNTFFVEHLWATASCVSRM